MSTTHTHHLHQRHTPTSDSLLAIALVAEPGSESEARGLAWEGYAMHDMRICAPSLGESEARGVRVNNTAAVRGMCAYQESQPKMGGVPLA